MNGKEMFKKLEYKNVFLAIVFSMKKEVLCVT